MDNQCWERRRQQDEIDAEVAASVRLMPAAAGPQTLEATSPKQHAPDQPCADDRQRLHLWRVQLGQRQRRLVAREAALADRTRLLADRETACEQRRVVLDARERELDSRERAIDQREIDFELAWWDQEQA